MNVKVIAWSRVLSQKITGSQLVKKFPAFYGTRMFTTAFTSARYQRISPSQKTCEVFSNIVSFYGDEFLAPRPTPQAGGPPVVGYP